MSNSYKDWVLTIYPNAIVAEDMDCDRRIYSTINANENRFAIIVCKVKIGAEVFQTSYHDLMNLRDSSYGSFSWQGGWKKTIEEAWQYAWEEISSEMLDKLES